MYVGSDGGLYRTDNARGLTQSDVCSPQSGGGYVGWTSLNNGFGVTQFYHGTAFPGGLKYMGGTQDNGTLSGQNGAPDSWIEINGGDGGYTALNPLNTNILYAENTALSLQKSTDGGLSFHDAMTGITESSSNFMFIAPFAMAPSEPDQLWIGGKSLWRPINAAMTWTQASAAFPGTGRMTAIAVDPGDPDHVIAGMSDGYIGYNSAALSSGSGASWPSCRPAIGWISSFAFDPANGQNVFATCSTFGQPHVLKSTNGGASWSDLTNDLPDVPAHSVAVDPDDSSRIFVGTDLGVFVSTNGGTNWNRSNDQFANVIIEHLEVERTSGRLFAFTHGRGVYSVDLDGDEPEDRPVLAPILQLLLGE